MSDTATFSGRIQKAIDLLGNDDRHDTAIAQGSLFRLAGDMEKAGLDELATRLYKAVDMLESDHRHDVSIGENALGGILNALVGLGR